MFHINQNYTLCESAMHVERRLFLFSVSTCTLCKLYTNKNKKCIKNQKHFLDSELGTDKHQQEHKQSIRSKNYIVLK